MASVNGSELRNDHGHRKPGFGRGGNNDYKAFQIVNMRNPCKKMNNDNQSIKISKKPIKICTWNVRTIFHVGKINKVIVEMNRLEIDVIGIREMRWSGNRQCNIW